MDVCCMLKIAPGCLLPEAIVHWRKVLRLLDITCLTFGLCHSTGGLVAFPERLQIKYSMLLSGALKSHRQTERGSDWTRIGSH